MATTSIPFLDPTAADALTAYEKNGYVKIGGWLGETIFRVLRICSAVQSSFGERGGAVEIGIFHGQFFIALNQLCAADEPSLAIDLFDAQHLNVDQSGVGSREAFEKNLASFCRHGGANVTILPADSTTVSSADINRLLPVKPRLFSIDGGHTVENTLHDLQLANECLSPAGVIFLDDILNSEWPGVIEAACRYMMRAPTIAPFALTTNKMLFCRTSMYSYYLQAFREWADVHKEVVFCGKTMIVC